MKATYEELEKRVNELELELKSLVKDGSNKVDNLDLLSDELASTKSEIIENDTFYKYIADFTYDWEMYHNVDGKLLYNSPSFERITGYKNSDFLNNLVKMQDIVLVNDFNLYCNNFQKSLKKEFILNLEFRIKTFNQEIRYLSLCSQPVYDNFKQFIGVRSSIRDITEVKQTESQYHALVKNIPGITYRCLYDDKWTMIYLSSEVDNVTGYGKNELLGNSVTSYGDLIHKDDREYTSTEVIKAIAKNEPWEIVYRVHHKDGSIRWAYEKGRAVYNEKGVIEYLDGFILDITERKQASEILKTRESYLTSIIENQPGLIWLKDEQSRFLAVNSIFANTCGIKFPKDLIGKTDFDIWPHDLAKKYRDDDFKVMESKKSYRVEEKIIENGESKWFETFKTPIFDDDGRIIGTTGYANDISERKRAEELLTKERQLFSAGPVFTIEWDPAENWPLRNVSTNVKNILGYSREELLLPGFRYADLIHPDDLELIAPETIHNVENHIDAYEQSYRMKHKSGEYRWFYDFTILDRDTEGNLIGIRGYLYDQTAQKQSEILLKSSEERFRTLFYESPDPYLIMDFDQGRIMVCNDATEKILGATKKDILNSTPADLSPLQQPNGMLSADLADQKIQEAYKHGSNRFEWVHKKFDGIEFWVDVSLSVIQYNKRKVLFVTWRDITKSKIAEEDLIKNEVLLKKLSAQLPGVIYQYRYHPDGRNYFPFASDNIYKIYEVTPEDVKEDASKVLIRLHPEDYQSVIAKILKSFETLELWEDDYRVVLPERGERWLRGIAKPEKLDDGSVLWYGYIADITDRKQTDIEFYNQREQFELAVKGTNDGIWDWNIVTNELFLSPRWKAMLGYEDEELENEFGTFVQLIHKDDIFRVQSYVSRYLQSEFDDYHIEFRMMHKDGSIRWILAKGEAIRNEHNIPVRMAGSHSDITKRKIAEEELKESEKQLDNALKLAKMGKWELDIKRGVFTFTDNFYRIFGTNAEEMGGYELSIQEYAEKFVHPDDAHLVVEESGKAVTTNDPNYQGFLEHRVKFIDGSIGYIAVRFFIEKDDDGNTIKTIGVNQDITSEKESENEIKRLLENIGKFNEDMGASIVQKNSLIDSLEDTRLKLISSNKEKDKFFSIIAHDLRSPFNGFLGLTKVMVEEIYDLSMREFHEYSKALHDSAENLYKLLDNLLTWASMKRDSLNVNFEKFNFKDSVEIAYNLQKVALENKNQKLEINVSSDLFVYADMQMISTVIRNLLSNAHKFTKNDGNITIAAKEYNNEVEISISDNGIGIPESILNKLFILGEKATRKGTNNESSSGLGLILCKEFIEKNNGKLWVESTEGIGTTFYFTLPKINIDEEVG